MRHPAMLGNAAIGRKMHFGDSFQAWAGFEEGGPKNKQEF